jgi:nucleoside phosphorylase
MLDEQHEPLPQQTPGDTNAYWFGRVGRHNVVIACLPSGDPGTTSAAVVAANMRKSFDKVTCGLMVGIGGGVPRKTYNTPNDDDNDEHLIGSFYRRDALGDVRLGDVVVSEPSGSTGGVVQYDYGRTLTDGHIVRTGSLNSPPTKLRTALSSLKSQHMTYGDRIVETLALVAIGYPRLRHAVEPPALLHDWLFEANYDHVGGYADGGVNSNNRWCQLCDKKRLVRRLKRIDDYAATPAARTGQQARSPSPLPPARPRVHYGVIASGNQMMRHGLTRDRISYQAGGVLCFEMEAAGLMNDFPCLVVRGISDYADSHANNAWQEFAAFVAAAYAKELLGMLPAVASPASAPANTNISHVDAGRPYASSSGHAGAYSPSAAPRVSNNSYLTGPAQAMPGDRAAPLTPPSYKPASAPPPMKASAAGIGMRPQQPPPPPPPPPPPRQPQSQSQTSQPQRRLSMASALYERCGNHELAEFVAEHKDRHRWEEALDAEWGIQQQLRKSHGNQHPATLESGFSLAEVFRGLKRYDDAAKYADWARHAGRAVLGERHPFTLRADSLAALILLEHGRPRPAEELAFAVLSYQTDALGENHLDTLTTRGTLARANWLLGNHSEALTRLRTCYEALKERLGAQHVLTATAAVNLASCVLEKHQAENQGSMDASAFMQTLQQYQQPAQGPMSVPAAAELVVAAHGTMRALLGDSHPLVLFAATTRGVAAWVCGDATLAHDLLRRAVLDAETALGAEHPDAQLPRVEMACLYIKQGRVNDAVRLLQGVLSVASRTHGPDNLEVAIVEWLLGEAYLSPIKVLRFNDANYVAAFPHYERALPALKRELGLEHGSTRSVLAGIEQCAPIVQLQSMVQSMGISGYSR